MEQVEEVKIVEEAKPAEKAIANNAIELNNGGLSAKNHHELKAMLGWIAEGGGFPKRFDTQVKQLAAYNLAQSLMGPQWQLALNHIAIIQGQMCIYGEFPGALAERTGEVEEKKVFLVDKEYIEICVKNKNLHEAPYAGVLHIKRKGRALQEFTYSVEDAKKAFQLPALKAEWANNKKTGKMIENDESPWNTHLGLMLMRKAMGMGIKLVFPDALIGVPIAEYDFNQAPDVQGMKDINPPEEDKASKINTLFGAKEQQCQ